MRFSSVHQLVFGTVSPTFRLFSSPPPFFHFCSLVHDLPLGFVCKQSSCYRFSTEWTYSRLTPPWFLGSMHAIASANTTSPFPSNSRDCPATISQPASRSRLRNPPCPAKRVSLSLSLYDVFSSAFLEDDFANPDFLFRSRLWQAAHQDLEIAVHTTVDHSDARAF